MTQPEYDQQKRECFVKFCKDNGIDQEVNISIFDAFDQIFDRAYSLGKQKETVTQGEIEKAAKDYAYYRSESIKRAEIQRTEQYLTAFDNLTGGK